MNSLGTHTIENTVLDVAKETGKTPIEEEQGQAWSTERVETVVLHWAGGLETLITEGRSWQNVIRRMSSSKQQNGDSRCQ